MRSLILFLAILISMDIAEGPQPIYPTTYVTPHFLPGGYYGLRRSSN